MWFDSRSSDLRFSNPSKACSSMYLSCPFLMMSDSNLFRPLKTPDKSVLNSFPERSRCLRWVRFRKMCPLPNCLILLFDTSRTKRCSFSVNGDEDVKCRMSGWCKSSIWLLDRIRCSVSDGMPDGTADNPLSEQLTDLMLMLYSRVICKGIDRESDLIFRSNMEEVTWCYRMFRVSHEQDMRDVWREMRCVCLLWVKRREKITQ